MKCKDHTRRSQVHYNTKLMFRYMNIKMYSYMYKGMYEENKNRQIGLSKKVICNITFSPAG